MKKNGKLRVCIDFRDLNNATPKDEYFMPIADMLIDSAAENEILSFMDGYSGYNQIFIAEDDVSKTAFRCPRALGTYEWVVMPFGLKNAAGNFLGFVVHKKGIAIDKNKADAILALSAPKSKKEVQSFLGKVNYLRRFISNLSDRTRVFTPLIKAYLSKAPIMANVRPHEPLKLYIAASINTIGCMLAQDDENGHERAVYYLSRVLTDIETRYSPIEKLCLSLYYACMKLKCYMVAKSVKVIAQTDLIKYMLSFPMLRGKWMLALTEFDLQYVPAKSVKGQVIADFLHKDGAGVGILIISPEEVPSEFLFELKYIFLNKVAEYEALILGLKILINKGALEVQILGDFQLVLKIHNKIANELAQIASRYRIGPETLKKLTSIHQILVPANEREALCIDEWGDNDWRKPIAQYLKDPNIQVDRKMKLQAINFVLMADELYKKGIDGNLLRCLGQDDQNVSLGKKMKWVLYRNHVYWPSMIKDCIDYAKACQECHYMIPASELHSIIKPWSFRRWALDLIGLIHPPSSKQHKFILVAIDYFTKWVEAIPLVEVGQSEIIDFVEEHIIHRFGIPQTLSTDQGTIFTGQQIKNFTASRNINMITSTPYYAQANGQVEAANKILISLIKKHIGNKLQTWHETLSQVL
ncbi:hypothetical protein AAHE18_14G102400 [Arachis hypogaea]